MELPLKVILDLNPLAAELYEELKFPTEIRVWPDMQRVFSGEQKLASMKGGLGFAKLPVIIQADFAYQVSRTIFMDVPLEIRGANTSEIVLKPRKVCGVTRSFIGKIHENLTSNIPEIRTQVKRAVKTEPQIFRFPEGEEHLPTLKICEKLNDKLQHFTLEPREAVDRETDVDIVCTLAPVNVTVSAKSLGTLREIKFSKILEFFTSLDCYCAQLAQTTLNYKITEFDLSCCISYEQEEFTAHWTVDPIFGVSTYGQMFRTISNTFGNIDLLVRVEKNPGFETGSDLATYLITLEMFIAALSSLWVSNPCSIHKFIAIKFSPGNGEELEVSLISLAISVDPCSGYSNNPYNYHDTLQRLLGDEKTGKRRMSLYAFNDMISEIIN